MGLEDKKDDSLEEILGQLQSKGKRCKEGKPSISSVDENGRSNAPDGVLGKSNTHRAG